MNIALLIRAAPWVSLAVFVVWFIYRGEKIDALQQRVEIAEQQAKAATEQAENLNAAFGSYVQSRAVIDAESNETRAVINRSFTSENSTAFFPAAVFERLRNRADKTANSSASVSASSAPGAQR